MKLNIEFVQQITAEVNPIDVLEKLLATIFVHSDIHEFEGALYTWEDIGFHKSEFRRKLITDKSEDIEFFRNINSSILYLQKSGKLIRK